MRLHTKYGVNPTIPICFVCGKEKNELVLLGASYKEEAPMKMCLNREPCEECKGLARKGVVLISVKDKETGDNPFRTGKIIVIKDEAFERIFGTIKSRFCFIEDSVLNKIQGA